MDLEPIEKRLDSKGMRFILDEFSAQCKKGLSIGEKFDARPFKKKKLSSIILQGMGGSGITGRILLDLLKTELRVPFIVNASYELPEFAGKETLFIAVSYSGNTEETLAGLREAKKKNCLVLGIGSGGKLEEECQNFIQIPKGIAPRTATAYLVVPLLVALHRIGLVKDNRREIIEMIEFIESEQPSMKNVAVEIANKLKKRVPIVCAMDCLQSTGIKWKTDLNENAKAFAHTAILPEANHNEIVGFESLKTGAWVFLLDQEGNERVKTRVKFTKEIIEEKLSVIEVMARGPNRIAKLFYLIYLGGWVSYFLAILRGFDPWEIKNIDLLKKKLSESK